VGAGTSPKTIHKGRVLCSTPLNIETAMSPQQSSVLEDPGVGAETVDLFVPGRVCLFGEHSDWAGQYREENAEIPVGYCILSGTHEGLYARAELHPTHLKLQCRLSDDTTHTAEWEATPENLQELAKRGEWYSYICGVLLVFQQQYLPENSQCRGLILDNYKTTLPVKKGLSSSAAVCVLVARALGQLHSLGLDIRQEMDLAYHGEIQTPSRCGRMDQGCAYGPEKVILMTFDGPELHVEPIEPLPTKKDEAESIELILVDLHASKNTPAILSGLQEGYPFAKTDIQKGVHYLLGEFNHSLQKRALRALQQCNAQELGQCMADAQASFDEYAMPACPAHLTSPVLHKVLTYPPLLPHIWGGKGVGSQGDGSAQLVAKSQHDRDQVIAILERDLGMSCISLSLGGKKPDATSRAK